MQSKRKGLPVELLVDIFKSADRTIMKMLPGIHRKDENLTLKYKKTEKLWINYSNNLLTSSSIVNAFVGKALQERWEKRRLRDEKIARSEERIARLREEIREINEELSKRRKTDLDANSIAKRTRSHAQENGPVAKRTRSQYSSTLSKNGKETKK
uniref:Uncharacterized protein n=1 Tax=Meloidogyne hapla TaxID=6305 RepID=A0A1I8BSJ9_MELHA